MKRRFSRLGPGCETVAPCVGKTTHKPTHKPTHMPTRKPIRKLTTGQSMVEYLVLAAITVALIAVPIQGNRSAVELVLTSVQIAYTKFLTALSLPQ